ncbi:UTP-glucose-1-phosphate uridylyltransferase [Thermincola ferriacetica]|uniref:UTP--glucose-1-phosphate uridylyltransferase n=1 Tax=Thermincola ferriacetica TaxID=281456 RepID=A0A0L6W3D7_9FIRM|nr:UTP--glucose-1-phosphate uridylyltransferase GalU [Thermincola ferriacetica]KNZ69966.1 UTP-glucose-1-phosphate uridylyltransferase [Thermincola ferriacetica]
MKKIRKAVIPAGGWGTRCLPASKAIPKEMLPIVDKPAIHYVVEEAVAAGITDILIITGRNKDCIADYFDRNLELETFLEIKGKNELLQKVRHPAGLVNIYYTRQKEPKGLGHAVSLAREFVGREPFAVLLPDDLIDTKVPCLKQMVDMYERRPGTTVAVMEVPREEVKNYGIIKPVRLTANVFVIRDLVEKPAVNKAPSNLAIVGRYIIEPEVFACLDKVEPGAGGEIQLTDALRMLLEKDELYAYKFFGNRYDVGNIAGFVRANIQLGLNHPEFGSVIEKEIMGILDNRLKVG